MEWKVDRSGGTRKVSSLLIGTKYLVERCFSLHSDTGLPVCEYRLALTGEGGRDRPE